MLPTVLTLEGWTVFLLGSGSAVLRRLEQVSAAKAATIRVYSPGADANVVAAAGSRLIERWPTEDEWQEARVAFVAGEAEAVSRTLAEAARAARVLVNVEDVPVLCDFHVPAMVRRGNLLMTVSTAGKAPGLARAIRKDLEARFGPEWQDRIDVIAEKRQNWRAGGHDMATVAEMTQSFLKENGWLI